VKKTQLFKMQQRG